MPKSTGQETRGHFVKLGTRRYLVISIVMAAAIIEIEDELVAAARVAVGACSEIAMRLAALEEAMVGRHVDGDLGMAVTEDHLGALAPIDDIRAPAAYRRRAAFVLVTRLINEIGAGQ